MGHGQAKVAAVPVLQPGHVAPDLLPPSALPPEIRRLHHGQRHLLAADGVHLFADDLFDASLDPQAEGQVGEDAGSHLPDETRAKEQLVAGGFRVALCLAQRLIEEL